MKVLITLVTGNSQLIDMDNNEVQDLRTNLYEGKPAWARSKGGDFLTINLRNVLTIEGHSDEVWQQVGVLEKDVV